MKIHIIASLAALLLLAGAPAHAKSVPLMGSVVQPSNAATPGSPGVMPAEGVQVQIKGTSQSTTTDAMGAFRFGGVGEGDITIVATKAGFAPTVKNYTHKGPTPGNVVLYLMPGAGMTQTKEPERPDTVYVAFSGQSPTTQAPGGHGSNNTLSGPPATNMGTLGAIAAGQDPFTMGGTAPVTPPQIPGGPGDFNTIQNASENSIMVLDPEQPQQVKYMNMASRGFWVTFNVSGTKLFVATDQQTIQVYDVVNNNILLANIPTGGVVGDLVRAGSFIYAPVMSTSSGILVIEPQKNAPIRMIPTPVLSTGERAHPRSVAVNSDGTRLYVALDANTKGEVAVVDAFTTRVLGFAQVGAQPLGIALTPDNRFILVTNGKASTVTVLDAFSLQQVAVIPVGVQPVRIAVRPDGTKAYVACKGSNAVHVVNLQTLSPGPIIPVGTNPMGIAVTSTGNRVFVACNGNGTVGIIDGNTDTFIKATTPQPMSKPFGVAVKP